MDVKRQTETLMNELVAFAEKMLGTHGEFHPFGGYLDKESNVVHVGVRAGEEGTSPQARVDALTDSFASVVQENGALAFGIVTNVSLSEDGENVDAIRVFLEHSSGYCADVFFHYKMMNDQAVRITKTTAQQGVPMLFSQNRVAH